MSTKDVIKESAVPSGQPLLKPVLDMHLDKARQIANELMNSKENIVSVIMHMQFNLLKHVVMAKQLHNLSIDELAKNTLLAIVDELGEIRTWDLELLSTSYTHANIEKIRDIDIELAFEYIDILHFVAQLFLLGAAKEVGITTCDELVSNQEIVKLAIERYDERGRSSLNFMHELVTKDVFLVLSDILSSLRWKHWKTYQSDPFDINKYYGSLIVLFNSAMRLTYAYANHLKLGDIEHTALIMYIVKNIENFDRQNRGY